MLKYRTGRAGIFSRALTLRGSVFPYAFCIALPAALLTAGVKFITDLGHFEGLSGILTDNAGWSGFVFLVGFLSVFRTSQAYARFWEGVTSLHQMRAEWLDGFSLLVALCRHSRAEKNEVHAFQQILVRLFSMLHAVSLAEIEEHRGNTIKAFTYELLDAAGLDRESITTIKLSDNKVELVYQWVQQLVVDNIENTQVLSTPAPILTRAFQELAAGMSHYHDALKISCVPFPFPYTQTCECLLMLHWVCTPFVVAQWVSTPWWGALFSFLQVFVYWSLNAIANEIEQPFGTDPNDVDSRAMQVEFNSQLLLLLETRTQRTPTLAPSLMTMLPSNNSGTEMITRRNSFVEIWTQHAQRSRSNLSIRSNSLDRISRESQAMTASDSGPEALAALVSLGEVLPEVTAQTSCHSSPVARCSGAKSGRPVDDPPPPVAPAADVQPVETGGLAVLLTPAGKTPHASHWSSLVGQGKLHKAGPAPGWCTYDV